ncbi:MAG TPA: two-component regulator propeller domain-containing protein, partial [Haliscomenobacter sp.]|nr:two-component regulator propeller domain-containing protein [Haliscomenobacter sp.]
MYLQKKQLLALKAGILMMTIFVACLLRAQNAAIPFRYFSLKEGLSDWTVTALQKDPSGLLWIGTAHGLQRFDGYKYLTFSTKPSSAYLISDHYVNSVKLFKDSLLVVTYSRNNELFDLLDYRNFKKNTVILKQSGITPSEQVQTICVDEEGNVLVFTQYTAKGRKMIALYEFDVA